MCSVRLLLFTHDYTLRREHALGTRPTSKFFFSAIPAPLVNFGTTQAELQRKGYDSLAIKARVFLVFALKHSLLLFIQMAPAQSLLHLGLFTAVILHCGLRILKILLNESFAVATLFIIRCLCAGIICAKNFLRICRVKAKFYICTQKLNRCLDSK